MPDHLDAEAAWSLLLALASPGDEAVPRLGERGELEVRPDGSWAADPTPTDEARTLLDLYAPLCRPGPLVVGQLAQSLDGRIATESGHSHYVSGPEDRDRLHRVRALVDAVVVGAGTVEADDPRLTVRRAEGANPVRVVLDPEGRLDPAHRLFSDGEAPTLVVRAGDPSGVSPEGDEGVEIVAFSREGPDGFDPHALLRALSEHGLERVLVEGGGITVSRFLDAGALDRLHVTVAPLIVGSGRPGISLPGVASLDEALRPPCRLFVLGSDVLFDLDLSSGAGSTPREGS